MDPQSNCRYPLFPTLPGKYTIKMLDVPASYVSFREGNMTTVPSPLGFPIDLRLPPSPCRPERLEDPVGKVGGLRHITLFYFAGLVRLIILMFTLRDNDK